MISNNRGSVTTRRLYIISACFIAACLALVLFVLSLAGKKGKIYLPARKVIQVSSMHEASRIWKQYGVRGRTLLLFDRRLNAHRPDPPEEPEAPAAYIYRAVMDTTVRKIYHIIPSAAWPEVLSVLRGNPFVSPVEGGFRTATDDGVPVYIMQLDKARLYGEPVLVNLNLDVWSPAEAAEISRLIDTGAIPCDLMIIAGGRTRQ